MQSSQQKTKLKVLEFPSTAGFKRYETVFTKESIRHPAKANLNLLSWIIDKFTEAGEWVLDPMAGTFSTCVVGALKGRNCVGVELEQKFVDMGLANKQKVDRLKIRGKGECIVLQGDSRNLTHVLREFDVIVTSPAYGEQKGGTKGVIFKKDFYRKKHFENSWKIMEEREDCYVCDRILPHEFSDSSDNVGNLSYGKIDAIVSSPPYSEANEGGGIFKEGYKGKYGEDKKLAERHDRPSSNNPLNVGNLKHGNIDTIITSPPYSESDTAFHDQKDEWIKKKTVSLEKCSASKENIASLPHGNVDVVITSPPYEEGLGHGGKRRTKILTRDKGIWLQGKGSYSESKNNVGEMRGETYLSAMHTIYTECHKVLKPNSGLMILITKNFIRKKALVRLDLDTIKLCEHVGFNLKDRYYFKLPQQSFWRINYYKKYPDAPKIEFEDVLIFQKEVGV